MARKEEEGADGEFRLLLGGCMKIVVLMCMQHCSKIFLNAKHLRSKIMLATCV